MKNRNRIAAGVIVIAAALAMAVPVLAAPPQGTFSNFDNARVVIGGLYPGLAATDLTSILCTSEASIPDCGTLFSADGNTSDSGIEWVPNTEPMLSSITLLHTFYNMGATACRGGAPRFVIFLDDGMDDFLVGYFGLPPSFGNCPVGWQNTGNFVRTSDTTARWTINNGNTYMSYADASAAFQSAPVMEIDLIVDGGWDTGVNPRGQDMLVDDFGVNNDLLHISQ